MPKTEYIGISTLEQEQRGPRYAPHINVTTHTNWSTDETQVVCMNCLQRWYHPRGERMNTPRSCKEIADDHPEADDRRGDGKL